MANLFLKTATQGATPLGLKAGTSTLLEALLKGETVEPTVPSTTKSVESGTEGKGTFTLEVPALLKAELLAGGKITGLTVHLYAENGGASGTLKRIRFGVVSPSVTAEPEIPKGTPEWRSEVSLTKEQAEALTLADLEALELLLQSISGKAWNAYELYVSVTTAAGGTIVEGKASGAMLLTGTAKGVAANVVAGKASGPLLLEGAATGTVHEGAIVKGKAAGTLTLAGTAQGIASNVVGAKATGVLRLTGASTGVAANRVPGKASGTLTLAGTATAAIRAVVEAKATGMLLLTGTSKGHTGGEPSTRKTAIFIFED